MNEFDFKNCETIETDAFKDCSSITSLKIPKSMKNVDNAFSGCDKVETIIFENDINDFKIDCYGFKPSGKLKEVRFNNVFFAKSAFAKYNNLKIVKFNNKQINIPDNCFEGCTNLVLPQEYFKIMEEIGDYAFAGCKSLNDISLSNINHIGKNAFENCSNIQSISFGNNLKELPESVCAGCLNLTDVKVQKEIERIGKYAFSRTKIKELDIYESVKYVDSLIFKDNESSVKVIVPNKKISTISWAVDWDSGFAVKHKLLKFMNPKVILVERK